MERQDKAVDGTDEKCGKREERGTGKSRGRGLTPRIPRTVYRYF